LNDWFAALLPSVLELDREVVLRKMLGTNAGGAFTVKLAEIVCGELLALVSVMVIVAE